MKKRLVGLFMAGLFGMACLTGCSGNTAADTDTSTETEAVQEEAATEEAQTESAANTGEETSGEWLVGFANNSDTYNYCAKFRSYLKDATEAKGITIMVTDAAGDTNVQNGQIDDFIAQNANVVSAISNDLDGSVPALEAAKVAGVPYISFLTSVSGGDDYDGYIYVGSPNEDAGKAQGQYLVEVLPENAKILYFTGEPNDQQYID